MTKRQSNDTMLKATDGCVCVWEGVWVGVGLGCVGVVVWGQGVGCILFREYRNVRCGELLQHVSR